MNWDQLRAILWLRWRLTRNQFSRGGSLNVVVSVLLLGVMLLAGLGLGIGGLLAGYLLGAKVSSLALLLIWDGLIFAFLIFWLSGLMIEIQRSESIDLTKLLHLPVTLHQVFVLNYVASHFTPSIVVLGPGILGLCVGLTVSAGPAMALLIPVSLAFLFMITAWTYCLRGWLAALMVNKRRRRAIIVWVTIAFVLVGQLPNLIFNSPYFRAKRSASPSRQQGAPNTTNRSDVKREKFALPEILLQAHLAVPPGWVGFSAMSLKERNPFPALGATALSGLIAALGLMRAYRMTMRFYQGAEDGSKPQHVVARQTGPRGRLLVECRVPGMPDDTAALALATFRSLVRAPELKMALIMPLVMGFILGFMYLTRTKHALPAAAAMFAATGVVMFTALAISPTMSNTFGLDRSGFRALVLLPTRRHHILFAKNLAFFPFAALVAIVLLCITKLVISMTWGAFFTGFLQVPTAFLLFSLTSNVVSILAPHRLAVGSLKASKPKGLAVLAGLISFLILPVVILPILIPPALQLLSSFLGWPPWLPVNMLAAAVILAAAAGLYWLVLPFEGRLLEQREQAILRAVTEEVE